MQLLLRSATPRTSITAIKQHFARSIHSTTSTLLKTSSSNPSSNNNNDYDNDNHIPYKLPSSTWSLSDLNLAPSPSSSQSQSPHTYKYDLTHLHNLAMLTPPSKDADTTKLVEDLDGITRCISVLVDSQASSTTSASSSSSSSNPKLYDFPFPDVYSVPLDESSRIALSNSDGRSLSPNDYLVRSSSNRFDECNQHSTVTISKNEGSDDAIGDDDYDGDSEEGGERMGKEGTYFVVTRKGPSEE